MTRLPRVWIIPLCLLVIGAFSAGVYSGEQLSSSEARRLIATAGGFRIKDENVHIRNIDMGPGGQTAIVEALVQVAFRFSRKGGSWSVAEIRTGDRRWDDLEMIRGAMDFEKKKKTSEDLSVIAAGLTDYRAKRGSLPQVKEFPELMDLLFPDFLPRLIREDAWDRPLELVTLPGGLRIASAGPDGRIGTDDDIVVEVSR